MTVMGTKTNTTLINTGPPFDIRQVRSNFPILEEVVHNEPLIYLDNASTSQKPQVVIDAMIHFFLKENASVHRGIHFLSDCATEAYENARATVRGFLNAEYTNEIIFVRGTTESINLVAQTYGKAHVYKGDEIVITEMEHHANIVPWQMLCKETGALLRVAPINDKGELILEELEKLLGPKTKIVAVAHVSNVLGTINPIQKIVKMAHAWGACVLVDGAQAASHLTIDVQELGCDFYVFSGHKMYGPSGIGVLYGRRSLLEKMPPYQGGGNMILSVSFEKTIYNEIPHKFEAGTQNVAGAIGLSTAINFLINLRNKGLKDHETDILEYGISILSQVPGLNFIGTADTKTSILSFTLDGIHPHDIGTILDQKGIAIRVGHHCAQPLMSRFGVPATARVSFACYNTRQEVDRLKEVLQTVQGIFQ